MHELSLVKCVLDEALRIAETEGAVRITRVSLQIGALKQVVPQMMQFAFEAASQDTAAEGAAFEWRTIPALISCDECRNVFEPSSWVWECPHCGVLRGTLEAGDELILESVELEEPLEEVTHEG